MKVLRFRLKNKAGLHARPAAVFVREVKKLDAQILIRKDNKVADGKNVLQVLSLGADVGDEIEIIINGKSSDDEDNYAKIIENLINEVLPNLDNARP
ncbi:MAG: HPr family phosphocarrier protein [Infirmifilum sp.]